MQPKKEIDSSVFSSGVTHNDEDKLAGAGGGGPARNLSILRGDMSVLLRCDI